MCLLPLRFLTGLFRPFSLPRGSLEVPLYPGDIKRNLFIINTLFPGGVFFFNRSINSRWNLYMCRLRTLHCWWGGLELWVTNHQENSAAGDLSRVTAISGQWERHWPFNRRRTFQGLCLTELPGWQQGQPPACRDGTEMLLSPKSSVCSPSVYQYILKPNYASAAPVGLVAAGLMSFMRPVFHRDKMKTLQHLE